MDSSDSLVLIALYQKRRFSAGRRCSDELKQRLFCDSAAPRFAGLASSEADVVGQMIRDTQCKDNAAGIIGFGG